MPTTILICPDCEKRYRFQGKPGGKVLHCRECGRQLELAADVPMRQRLKHELTRLSAASIPEEPEARAGATIHISERKALRINPWVLWAVLALLLAGAGGGGWWAYARAHRPPPELPPQARAAIAKAERSDVPGGEEAALADWRTASGMILAYRVQEGLPDAFQDDIGRITARIRQLQATVRQRQAVLEPLQKALIGARTALDAGRSQEAVTALEALLAQVPKADLSEVDRERLRSEAENLLTLARSAVPAAPAAAPAAPGRIRRRAPTRGVAPATTAAPSEDLLLDRPGNVLAWRAETWGNPATLSLEAGSALAIQQEAGTEDKWALSMNRALDVRPYGKLALEIESARPIRVSAAVWTGAGPTMFESPPETIRGGGWCEVSFALKGRRFKCEASNWQFGAALENPESVTRLAVIFYDRSQTPLRIRNVRLTTR